ncbi:MAG: SctK family type III secretion system sorting platform protein [Kiritimatiellae bacterium]|nr:SctK family type III secretion system sorting platform protein [Kiritimatiellia bacterium]
MGEKKREFAIDEARELVANRLLWLRVRDFLWDFAPQVHESWLEDIRGRETMDAGREAVPSQVSRLASSPRVKRFILDQLGVEPCFHDFPKDDGSRLALLDGATLLAIVRWLGALACADELRKVTDGKTVRALKAALPGVYPDVFGYTAYFPLSRGDEWIARRDAETQSLADQVVLTGFNILLSARTDLPASLVSRLKLKLPKSLCDSASLRETTSRRDRKDAVARAAILKLLKLKFPEAYSLCCL